jgi:hypothetical protein
MIIENGYIRLVQVTGGGMKGGIPQPAVEVASNAIPCNIKTIKHNRGISMNGVYTQSSYEVLIDSVIMPRFEAEKVLLTDNRGNELGEFRMQDVQHLDAVGVIKVIV